MRILSGNLRGKKLPGHDHWVRPTSAYRREMIFNRLVHAEGFQNFDNITVLDVFAGTGSLGFEALSRGAKKVFLMEKNPTTHRNLLRFIENENLQNQTTLYLADATDLPKAPHSVDLCFLDAPYHKNLIPPALESLRKKGWLKHNTLCVAETSTHETLALPSWMDLPTKRTKGKTCVWFFEQKA